MSQLSTLAAVDLGSNSFRLEVARVVDDQIYPLDSLREPVRLGAGLTADKRLDEASQARALDALHRFGERLREMPPRGGARGRAPTPCGWPRTARSSWRAPKPRSGSPSRSWPGAKRRGSSTWVWPTACPSAVPSAW